MREDRERQLLQGSQTAKPACSTFLRIKIKSLEHSLAESPIFKKTDLKPSLYEDFTFR